MQCKYKYIRWKYNYKKKVEIAVSRCLMCLHLRILVYFCILSKQVSDMTGDNTAAVVYSAEIGKVGIILLILY